MLNTITRPKIRDVIADKLRAYIVDEQLQPGSRLPTEAQLAEQFGVSRLSLREATTTLEFLGVLESRPGRGLTVGEISFERVAGFLQFHPSLQYADPLELIHTRVALETGVLPYVSERMQADPDIHRQLHEINDGLRKAKTLKRWIELDIAFHRSLVASSGLASLLTFADLLTVFFLRFRESVQQSEWMQGVEAHQKIIDALCDGHVDVAREELRTHIEYHKTRPTSPT